MDKEKIQRAATQPIFSVRKGAGYTFTLEPNKEVFMAGIMSPIGSGNFISLSRGDLEALSAWIQSILERTKNG